MTTRYIVREKGTKDNDGIVMQGSQENCFDYCKRSNSIMSFECFEVIPDFRVVSPPVIRLAERQPAGV